MDGTDTLDSESEDSVTIPIIVAPTATSCQSGDFYYPTSSDFIIDLNRVRRCLFYHAYVIFYRHQICETIQDRIIQKITNITRLSLSSEILVFHGSEFGDYIVLNISFLSEEERNMFSFRLTSQRQRLPHFNALLSSIFFYVSESRNPNTTQFSFPFMRGEGHTARNFLTISSPLSSSRITNLSATNIDEIKDDDVMSDVTIDDICH